MKIIYQLSASGPLKVFPSSVGKIVSGTVFLSKTKAQDYIETFKKKCCNSESELFDLDPEFIRIEIVKLKLDEE